MSLVCWTVLHLDDGRLLGNRTMHLGTVYDIAIDQLCLCLDVFDDIVGLDVWFTLRAHPLIMIRHLGIPMEMRRLLRALRRVRVMPRLHEVVQGLRPILLVCWPSHLLIVVVV